MKCFRCQAKTNHFGSIVGLAAYSTSLSVSPTVFSNVHFQEGRQSRNSCWSGSFTRPPIQPFYLFVPHFTGHSPFLSFDGWLVTISPFRGFLLTRQWREQRLGGLSNVFTSEKTALTILTFQSCEYGSHL